MNTLTLFTNASAGPRFSAHSRDVYGTWVTGGTRGFLNQKS